MDIVEVIFRRISIRTYLSYPAGPAELEAVRRAGEAAEALTGSEMRFHLCTEEQVGREIKGIIGDYGRTIRAPHYLVLSARECDGCLTDAGFRFEQMVLDATARGLGTCWVGMMFRESSLRAALGLDASWRVIVLSPVGRPADPTFTSRMLRRMAGSAGRRPIEQLFFWQRHGRVLPAEVLTDSRLARVLEAARRAPSWMNKQPWRFVLSEREVLLYKLKQQDREGKDYHALDCGIAMCHVHLAARALGIKGRWELATFEVPGAAEAEPIGRYVLETGIRGAGTAEGQA
jgi:nitroreductase